MPDNTNPQAEQMAHESMVRNLAAQANAIWPQERPLFDRYELPARASVVDAGCGPGEIILRLAETWPQSSFHGIDVDPAHLELARRRCAPLGDRVRFTPGDAFHLPVDDRTCDLAMCRHLLQAVPEPWRVVDELIRVTRPGGILHLVAEDYGMMHFHPVRGDNDQFWRDGPMTFAERTGSDLRSGRTMYTILAERGLADVRVDYVVIDPVRVPRDVFANIWVAWRDGYADAIATHSELEHAAILEQFEDMIAAIRSEKGYGVWFLPVISGRVV
ncbi:MAG: class I SAM-dependent methyltransferase [Phycisphaerales bacterium]|nr:class I SAM-dependent methyltransferase [Phycisphaerales bacterium]NNM27410.1 class I SAM-dependent methyltransferase [Phycisphaerales bacterium]